MLSAVSKLSESLLWPLGKKAYARFGIDCWNVNAVPFHITSNSRIALQYARIASTAYKGEPMTFLELGGGSGKFAYLFIAELLKMGISSFRYVLTDLAEKNVAFWNAHPLFHSWIEQGLLFTAVYDPLVSDPLPYVPDFVIANYLFGTIPQDLFQTESGHLFEARVSLQVDEEESSWDDPEILSKIRDAYAFELLKTAPYQDLPEAAAILDEYSSGGDGTFIFPIGAFRLIRSLEQFCKPGFLLLAADRGPWTKEQLRLQSPPQISHHKTVFSFPVNFHAIGRFIEKTGGEVALPAALSPAFGAGLFSLQPIKASIRQAIFNQQFGPLETVASDRSQILDRLDEANWDATLFFFFFDRLQEATGEEKQRLLAGMCQIPGRFFPLFREEACLLDRLGFLFQAFDEEEQARSCFEAALRLQTLPRQVNATDGILAFLEEHKPADGVLQIGGDEQIGASIRAHIPGRYVFVSWDRAAEAIGVFDRIYLFPPDNLFVPLAKKPQLVREIEQQFPSLETMVYSDRDIEAFLNQLAPCEKEHARYFFRELQRKNQITVAQLKSVLQQLGFCPEAWMTKQGPQVFEILKHCLDRHWKGGTVLRYYLPRGVSLYDNPKIFDEIIVDPNLYFEEKQHPQAVWGTVLKEYPVPAKGA